MSDTRYRFGSWLIAQLTWRNTVRLTGLLGMIYLIVTKNHPDATALVALGTMVGLPTFLFAVPVMEKQKDDQK